MKPKNKTIGILMLIMLVNALSYGTIIPLLYPYASRFGITPLGLSFLFASFSLAQLIATPIMGRLSDKFGRKPLLLISLGGTGLSLALFASATSAPMLFVARILDGITGGNVSVAQAAIADSTTEKERAQSFGLLGAAFGFGFLFGPALGGVLSTISLSAPFWFASGLATLGTLAGVFMLKETLPSEVRNKKSINRQRSNILALLEAFKNPNTGLILIISLIYAIALNAWIIGFQTFSNDVLKLSTTNIGLIFATFGLISVIMQSWGIRVIMSRVQGKRKILMYSLGLSFITIAPLYIVTTFVPYFLGILFFGIVSAPIVPVLTALLSERTTADDQGGILGINQSVTSLGQIIGPLIAGAIAGVSVHMIFLTAAAIIVLAMGTTRSLADHPKKVDL